MKNKKKYIIFSGLVLLISGFVLFKFVYASNTYSIDLETSSTQFLSTTAAEVGIPSGNGDRTQEAWVKLESGGVLRMITSYGANSAQQKWHWGISTNNKQIVETHAGDASSESTTALTVGTWHHVAITYDGTTLRYYFDGLADGTATFASQPNTADNTTFRIGANLDQDVGFDGLIDDVRAWGDVRTAEEISSNMNTELTGNESGLVAYWKLNNGLLDETSNNNDLTINNSAAFSTDIPFTQTAPVGVRKSVTQVLSSDTTTDDDSELSIILIADTEYVIDGIVFASSTSQIPDIKVAFTAPSGSLIDIGVTASTLRNVEFIQTSDIDTDGIPIPADQPVAIQIGGTVKTGSTGGTLDFQWAQNNSNGNEIGVLRGSYLRADEI